MGMFFNKKEDRSKLPDLPPSPVPLSMRMSGVPDGMDERPSSLPTFPDKPMQNDFSQAAIKGAVSDNESFIGPPPTNVNVVEMEDWRPEQAEKDTEEVEEEMPMQTRMIAPPPTYVRQETSMRSKPQDVFVRIDRFHSARKALSEIKSSLQEVDDFVRQIREIKMREEQELSSWEKDIMHIKSRVQHVSESIFEKVE